MYLVSSYNHKRCKYILFCPNNISLSKLWSVSRFLFPVVASPPVEKIRSTGVLDGGVESRSKAAFERSGYLCPFCCQNKKGSRSSSNELPEVSISKYFFPLAAAKFQKHLLWLLFFSQ